MVSRDLKLLLAVLGIVLFLSVSVSVGTAKRSITTATTVTVHQVQIGREKLVYDPHLDFNYMMSKRKVPNGPDPIHNRRAGNSKRPPGRV